MYLALGCPWRQDSPGWVVSRQVGRVRMSCFGFYSAVFKGRIAKFQTFACNSRMIWPSYMKFWQHFEGNKMYVCTKFRGNRSPEFDFRTRKPSGKFGIKSGLIQNGWSMAKNFSHGCMSLDTVLSRPAHFWSWWVFFLFFLLPKSRTLFFS